ncbi:MAG TPA: hypothetical protein VHG10_13320 [Glycomyces sp.]|nr:hypothetical protein [Glycomyces sp.]
MAAYVIVAAIAVGPVVLALLQPVSVGAWLLLAAALLWALVLLIRLARFSRPLRVDGIAVPLHGRELRTLVDQIAALYAASAPERIMLSETMEVAVVERASWLGLRGGPTDLLIHPTLFTHLSADHLAALIAAEFVRHSRRRPAAARRAERIHQTLTALFGRRSIRLGCCGRLLRSLLRPLLTRYQDAAFEATIAADAEAARQAGADTLHSALVHRYLFQRSWQRFREQEVSWHLTVKGIGPRDHLGGFARFLEDRIERMVRIPRNEFVARPAWWSLEPPIGHRLADLSIDAEFQATETDGVRAAELVEHFGRYVIEFEDQVLNRGMQLLDWPEYTARATAAQQRRGSVREGGLEPPRP